MLTIKDLAEILVQKHQLDSRSAEAFVNAVIETIHEGLKNDRVVKVKGFGTFKLTAVRERESINVNTGERVVISSHDKVSFTPDAVLRDLVNKPFAQFDTVVLADGVDFEDMPEVETEDADVAGDDVADIPAPVQEEMINLFLVPYRFFLYLQVPSIHLSDLKAKNIFEQSFHSLRLHFQAHQESFL